MINLLSDFLLYAFSVVGWGIVIIVVGLWVFNIVLMVRKLKE